MFFLCVSCSWWCEYKMIDYVFGSVIWSVVKLIIFVVLTVICITLCCWCCKRCRKRKNKNYQMTVSPTVVFHVPQPVCSPGCQPSYPGYQPVSSHPGHSMSAPIAPPSYKEASLSQMNPPVNNKHRLELNLIREDLSI